MFSSTQPPRSGSYSESLAGGSPLLDLGA